MHIVANLVEKTAAVDFLSHMSLPQQQPQVNITTALDGKGAMNMCGKEREWVRLGSDHFDLIGINSSLWSRVVVPSTSRKNKYLDIKIRWDDLSLFWKI